MLKPSWVPIGFRARLFWTTGDVTLLEDLRTTYVVVDPDNLQPGVHQKLQHDSGLKLVFRQENPDGLKIREVYRVTSRQGQIVSPNSLRVAVLGLNKPSPVEPGGVFSVPLLLSVRGGEVPVTIRVSALIRDSEGLAVNVEEDVRQAVNLEAAGRGIMRGRLSLVAPFDPGDYEATLYEWRGAKRTALTGQGGEVVSLPIRVVGAAE